MPDPGEHSGNPEHLLREAARLARPGGFVALQEPDMTTLTCCPDNAAWELLKSALVGAFAKAGADICLGRRLFALARQAGLEDVQYRPFLIGVRSGDPMIDYLPATIELLHGAIIGRGRMTESELRSALADCRKHLREPDTVFTTYTVAQVWGRIPSPEGSVSREAR